MPKRRSLTELRDLALEQETQSKQGHEGDEANASVSSGGKRGRNPGAKRNMWVQLNVFVPESTRQELKIRALREGRDMSDIVAELLAAYLAE